MVHDFTKGRLVMPMIQFTIPFILANYLQLTYNAVDSIIVGRFLGPEALAAVGTSNPLMTLLIMLLRGTTLGTGVLIGTMFGAGDYPRLRKQISTALLAGAACSLVLSLAVSICASGILRLLHVDPSILPLASGYLRTISYGLIFTFLYNYLSSTMQALGDGKTPLIFLAISALTNIGGDLLLIVVFHLGVNGAAAATVLSEAFCCLLCILYIRSHVPVLNLGKAWFVFDMSVLRRTLQYGSVSAIQQATVQLGILGVQGAVNSLGMSTTAAFAAANRVDDFALIPTRSIANAMTSVIAQNWGARDKKRIRKAFAGGALTDIVYGALVGGLLFIAASRAMYLFTQDQKVVSEGEVYLRLICMMYTLPALTNAIQGFFRGVGDLKITLASSIVNMSIRFITTFVLIVKVHMDIAAVPYGCLAGWLGMLVWEIPFLIRRFRKKQPAGPMI